LLLLPPQVIQDVCENRLTGFSIHALILASIGMLPVLKRIPMPVVSGIFLYLGRKVSAGKAGGSTWHTCLSAARPTCTQSLGLGFHAVVANWSKGIVICTSRKL
jgi:HCO3- transporter family